VRLLEKRLHRLELAIRSRAICPSLILARINAGRHRLGLPPLPPAHASTLRGKSIIEILQAGRMRVHAAHRLQSTPQSGPPALETASVVPPRSSPVRPADS